MDFRMKKAFILIVFIILFSLLSAAGELVYDIRVEGNTNVDASLILSASSIKIGSPLKGDDAQKTIKNLYNLKVFEDVRIESQPKQSGIEIIISVREHPVVTKINFKGNKALSTKEVEEIINIRKGSYWSQNLKLGNTEKLKVKYQEKGYLNAEIDYISKESDDNTTILTLVFNEGRKVKIKKINIVGNDEVPEKKILRKMKTKRASLLRSGKYEELKYRDDLKIIIAYYNKLGYIDARIVSEKVEKIDERFLAITIKVNEGIKYNFGSVTVKGNDRFTSESILEKFTLKVGEPFDMEKFDRELYAISSMYYEEGYIYSQFDHILEKAGNSVNIKLDVTENNRAKVRKIAIQGNTRTKEKVIRRQLSIAPGDYFKQSKVIRSQPNIYNMGFFEPDIRPDYKPINKDGDIDLIFKVRDTTSGTINGGVGYNSQDSFVGQLSLSHNNLFGNYWSTSFNWEFGGSSQNFSWDFTNPYLWDTNTLFGYNIFFVEKEYPDSYYEVSTRGGSLRLGRPIYFLNRSKLVGRYSFYAKKYNIPDDNIEDVYEEADQNETLIDLYEKGWNYTSSVSFTFTRDTRDNIFFPRKGSQITFYNEIAGGPFLGDSDFYKQITQVNWYIEMFANIVLR
ncbi:MAG: outer membrane protein assembly factor BamA, partial [Candidatus Zophobacter franzmannii]|nr:outer membrane protein assembly factor BamA [Candidatus Zophobacter franzmannii]